MGEEVNSWRCPFTSGLQEEQWVESWQYSGCVTSKDESEEEIHVSANYNAKTSLDPFLCDAWGHDSICVSVTDTLF